MHVDMGEYHFYGNSRNHDLGNAPLSIIQGLRIAWWLTEKCWRCNCIRIAAWFILVTSYNLSENYLDNSDQYLIKEVPDIHLAAEIT